MSDERPSEVLGGLPHTRPHRRSEKRASPVRSDAGSGQTSGSGPTEPSTPVSSTPTPSRPRRPSRPASVSPRGPVSAPGATKRATPTAARVRQPAQPPGTPAAAIAPGTPDASSRRTITTGGVDLLGSAVNASAELAEIGISAGARALRAVVARLPRP